MHASSPTDPSGAFDGSAPGAGNTDDDELIGQVVGERYRVEETLGHGGMGAVYRATHVHMRKSVALKVLHQQMSYLPEAVARFEREAVAAGRISHPNVAAATDFGRLDDSTFYLALEFVVGKSLRQELYERTRLSLRRAVHIARQVAEALAAAHALDIVHRDLKPENIMLQENGPFEDFIKVLDFGLAKITIDDSPEPSGDAPTQLTKMGSVFGTPTYMSPEQAAGQAVDHRTDLYALGVLLYEMLAGHPPFTADAMVVVLSMHINEAPPPLPKEIDPRLSRLVMQLLAKSPDARPQSARQCADTLAALRFSVVPPALLPGGALRSKLQHVSGKLWTALAPLRAAVTPGLQLAYGWLVKRVPAVAVLERRVALGPVSLPLGAWASLGAGVLLLGSLLLVVGTSREDTPGAEPQLEAAYEFDADDTPSSAAPTEKLSKEEATLLTDIEAIPVYKRKLKDWLSLAGLHAKSGDWVQATAAYRNAIQLDRSQAKSPAVIGAIRQAVEQRKSYEAAINVATTLLGEAGMDVLYDLWVSTEGDRKQRAIHDLAYKKLSILRLRNASPALRIVLDLEFAKPDECDAIKKTVESAIDHADKRSVSRLRALEKTTGCGASKQRDCYVCLREDEDLQGAIEAAEQHDPPSFQAGKYVPAP